MNKKTEEKNHSNRNGVNKEEDNISKSTQRNAELDVGTSVSIVFTMVTLGRRTYD